MSGRRNIFHWFLNWQRMLSGTPVTLMRHEGSILPKRMQHGWKSAVGAEHAKEKIGSRLLVDRQARARVFELPDTALTWQESIKQIRIPSIR
jgi:hypothetical protein